MLSHLVKDDLNDVSSQSSLELYVLVYVDVHKLADRLRANGIQIRVMKDQAIYVYSKAHRQSSRFRVARECAPALRPSSG